MDIDLSLAVWRKSSYSNGSGGACVEVARNLPGIVAVRDSKDRQGPALVFGADHPYATGFLVTDADGKTSVLDPGQPLPLARDPGEHRQTVAVLTRYGTLTPQPLVYLVR